MARTHLWQADVFDMAVESDRIRLEGLRLSNASLEVHDTLDSQVAEWAICRNPMAKQDPSIMASTLTGLMEGEDWEAFGTWVHYPWSNRLVRLLPEEAFIEVRTNRNRNKISAEETAALRQKPLEWSGSAWDKPRRLPWPWNADAVGSSWPTSTSWSCPT